MSSKSGYEAKVERATWFALMIAFLAMTSSGVPGAWMCIILSIICFVSALYQYRRKMTVGVALWGAAFLGVAAGGSALYFNSTFDLSMMALGMVIVVIAMGVVTRQS